MAKIIYWPISCYEDIASQIDHLVITLLIWNNVQLFDWSILDIQVFFEWYHIFDFIEVILR